MTLYSPTRLDAFDPGPEGCIRLGAFKYWGEKYGYPREPKGENAKLGIELHKAGEDYQNEGKRPDRLTLAGELFIEGIPYLPHPETSEAEGEKQLDVAGHSYGMFIDLLGKVPQGPRAGFPHVVDYKTSSNARAYGLWQRRTTGQGYDLRKGFLDDIQAVLCASWQIVHTGDARADLLWLYFGYKSTKRKDPLTGETLKSFGPPFKAMPSYATLERSELEEAFGRLIHPRAELVAKLESEKADPLTLDFNPRRCHKYGRDCFYVPICNLQPEEKVFGIKSKPKPAPVQKVATMAISLADRLAAKRNQAQSDSTTAQAKAEAAPAPKSVPPPAPQASSKKEDKINPPESKARIEKVAVQSAAPAARPSTELYAILAQRIGEALIQAAKDMRG